MLIRPRFHKWLVSTGYLFVASCFGLGGVSTCFAQLSDSQRERLVDLSRQAKAELGKRQFPSADAAGANVIAAAKAVSDHFGRRSTEENRAKWIRYIGSDPLVDAISNNAPAEEIAALAGKVRERLVGDIRGLELRPMTALRSQTEQLVAALRFRDTETSIQQVNQQIDALIRRLEKPDAASSPNDVAALAVIVNLLDQSNQVPQLVDAIYASFDRPNLLVSLNGDLVLQAIRQDVDRSRPIRDCILGTTVIGNGRLRGEVDSRLVPCRGRVQIDLILTGQFNSQTVGYNGPVQLPTVGQGFITAQRSLWIDESGTALSPLATSASLKSTITSIQHPMRLVRRIAQKQIAQKKPRADAIARERFRSQVAADFDSQTSDAVNRPRGDGEGLAKLRDAGVRLRRFNLDEPSRTIGSTATTIYLEATQRSGKQLAATTAPPRLETMFASTASGNANTLVRVGSPATSAGSQSGAFDLAIQVHESLVDNVASRILAGRTVKSQEIDQLLTSIGRFPIAAATDAAQGDEASGKFEIDFSNLRPIIFEARDQTVRVGLRGTRFSQGDRELKVPIEITATYQHVDRGDEHFLQRVGPVEVAYPGGGRSTVQQVALRRTIQNLFDNRFPETLLDKPMIAPGANPAIPALAGRVFRAERIDARDGWLSIAVR
jgi:hypothetical protein